MLENNYYFDSINQTLFAKGSVCLGKGLWKGGDRGLIDGLLIHGTARLVSWISQGARLVQTGYLYQYAFAMILGVFFLLWFTAF